MPGVALGVDTSLAATGAVCVPFDWGLDWSRVARVTLGKSLHQDAKPAQQVERTDYIMRNLVEFARQHKATHAFIEGYAFSKLASRAHSLGEIGGLLKWALVKTLKLPLVVVPEASAKKLLGSIPRKDAKAEAHVRLTRAGAPLEWTSDELDAFLVANWGLSGIKGASALILEV